jgi:hypothetical protein
MFGLFKKKLDRDLLAVAGAETGKKIADSLSAGISIYETSVEEIDDALRCIVEAQLCFFAIFRPAHSYGIEDAYFKSGKLGFSEPLPAPLTVEDERLGLRQSILGFPTCKSNMDMRFRYMFAQNLATQGEDSFWNEVVTLSQPRVRQAFEQKREIHHFWVGAIARMGAGDAAGAWQILREG